MLKYTQLAITDVDQFIYGHAPHPVTTKSGLVIGGGIVYPELNFTLPSMEICEATLAEVRAVYRDDRGRLPACGVAACSGAGGGVRAAAPADAQPPSGEQRLQLSCVPRWTSLRRVTGSKAHYASPPMTSVNTSAHPSCAMARSGRAWYAASS